MDRTPAFTAGGLGSIPRMRRIFILKWTFSQRKCGQVGPNIKLEAFRYILLYIILIIIKVHLTSIII